MLKVLQKNIVKTHDEELTKVEEEIRFYSFIDGAEWQAAKDDKEMINFYEWLIKNDHIKVLYKGVIQTKFSSMSNLFLELYKKSKVNV